jgi:hypothetical protein
MSGMIKSHKLACLCLGLFSLFAFAACGGGTTNNGDGGNDGGFDGCQGNGQQLLSIVGNPTRNLYPGDTEDLQVVFLEKCVGAVAGQTVNFEIQQNPGGASLSSATSVTGANGLAKITLTVPSDSILVAKQFGVRAYHPSDPDGVYFTINLKPVLRQLSPVGPLTLDCYVNETIDVTVKLTDLDTNSPVRGVNIGFSIFNPPPGGDATIPIPQIATNLSGLATTAFASGTQVTTYQVVAEGVTDQVEKVTFSINVKQRQECVNSNDCPNGFTCVNGNCLPSGGEDCNTNDDCPDGYECKDGFCRPEGSLPDSCETSEDCPAGYYCEGHECYPCPEVSERPECQGGDECENNDDCPPGFICVNGICQPDNPDDVVIPELGGRWYTKHYFDMSGAFGGATVSTIINKLNAILNYCDITGIGWIDDLLCDLIDEYVPEWVGTLIEIFANLVTMLEELRSEGEMQLTHLNPRELVSGTEEWETIMIRYLNACCTCGPNDEPGNCCNPYQQPDWPDCATIDITRDDLDYGDVGLVVKPFTGKVQVDDSGAITKYTLLIDPREVEMEYSKFVTLLVNLLIQIFTGYDDLGDALEDIIDCEAIQDLVDDLLGSWAPNIESACDAFKPTAGTLLEGLLNQIAVDWSVLDFTGYATITTEDDPPYGTKLGYPNYEESQDGKWEGDVQIILQADMEGAWYAER